MKKLVLVIGLLLAGQLSFSQTTVKYVILKADDLIDGGGPNAPGRLSPAWQQFIQMAQNKNIKANLGINGSMCDYPGGDAFWVTINNLLNSGRFELWNHGWVHSPYPSYTDLMKNQDLVKTKTGATMIAYGAPENKYDAAHYASINSMTDIKYIMFGDPTMTSKTVWARDINIEYPTFVPDYPRFVSNYPAAIQKAESNGRDYLCLQVHPNNHTPQGGSRQTNLNDCIDFLKAQGLIFVTISEYKALHEGTTPPPSCGIPVAWSNSSFTNQTGSFTAEFDAVPGGSNMDGVVGLSNGAASVYSQLACAIQFATDGTIKARNGSTYSAANSVNYTAGTSYRIRMSVNVTNKTYSIYATPSGGSQQTIGANYAFRTDQSSVTQLNNRAISTLDCSLSVSNFTAGSVVTAPAAPTGLTASSGNGQVVLSWSASTGATSYTVKRSTTSGSGYTNVATNVTTTSYTNTGLTNGTTYYYVVSASNSGGSSGNSSQASATPSIGLINETFGSSAANFTVVRGGTWTVTGGKYVLTSAATTGAANGNISIHNTTVSGDYTLTADASATASSSAWDDFSIIFNYQNATNYYYVSLNESNDANTSGIFKISGGVITQLADITSLIIGGTTYAIKIERNGNTITAYRNGTQIATASDGTFTSGKVGFGTLNNGASFDNLIVNGGVSAVGRMRTSSIDTTSEIQGTEESPEISIYPNPTSGSFSVEVSTDMATGYLNVMDAYGRTILSKELNGDRKADIDLSEKTSGVYLVSVVKDGKKVQNKLVKK